MRVIIEVDNEEEIEHLAGLLDREVLKGKPVELRRPPTEAERQALLDELFQRYRIHLPANWKMDRDELHRRDRPSSPASESDEAG